MKVLLDNIIYSKTKNGGVSNYWFELSKFLLSKPGLDVKFIEDDSSKLNFHRQQLFLLNENVIKQKNTFPLLNRLLPIYHNSNDDFIYHSSFYRDLIGSKKRIEVTTVYDFIHDLYSPFIKKNTHNFLKHRAIKRSKGVICISKNTYADLKKFCPLNKNQVSEVIYVGVSDDYYPLEKDDFLKTNFLKTNNIEGDFLLYVGGRTNYKNFNFVLEIINSHKDLSLVIVGGGEFSANEKKLINNKSQSRIVFINSATNKELNYLYNSAFSLIYPSSYEGFGIPVIEAMRSGCPVIGLNNNTMREISSENNLLLENLDLNEFNCLKSKLRDEDFKEGILSEGFLNSKKYSWDKCNKETLEFYKELYK